MSWRLTVPLFSLSIMLAACATAPTGKSVPIERRTGTIKPVAPLIANKGKAVEREPDWRPKTHIVAKGDTLYSLALEYGLDYRELAQWNGLADANMIGVGQELKLSADEGAVVVRALSPKRPLIQPLPPETVLAYPKAIKLPWSETAVAELRRQLEAPPMVLPTPVSPPVAISLPDLISENKNKAEPVASAATARNPVANTIKRGNDGLGDDEALEWALPTQGKLLSGYSQNGNKGWDIGGRKGQAIFSTSVGKVVYSGVGLRGYGKLIIIKHNKTYLSAYAHNQVILVKEGDNVIRGQKIAEMGDTDSDVVKLHFEIRRFGKPVDPSKYMPAETKP